MKTKVLFLLFFCLHIFGQAPGTLDTSFGVDGIVSTTVAGFSYSASLALQADEKIIVGGYEASKLYCIRYNNDGSIDTTFGNNGIASYNAVVGSSFYISTIAIQANQKIILGVGPIMVRFNPDGALDTSFGVNGKVTTNFNDIKCIKEEASTGKIVIGANVYSDSNNNIIIARFSNSGNLDLSFNTAGTKTLTYYPLGTSQEKYIRDLAIQQDGSISAVGGGWLTGGVDWLRWGSAYRVNADGTWDTTFDADGFVETGTQSNSMILKPDNSIIAAGANVNYSAIMMYRVNPNGTHTPDALNRFYYNLSNSEAKYLRQDINGKYVMTASEFSSSTPFRILVVNPDFTLDTSFGTNGVVTTTTVFGPQGLETQLDGKIVVLGKSGNTVKVARYHGSSILSNTSFDKDSFSIYPNPSKSEINVGITDNNLLNKKFEIQDVNGRIVSSGIISGLTTKINISAFNNGIYFLSIENTATALKIIKL